MQAQVNHLIKIQRLIYTDKVGSGQGFTVDSGIQSFQNELEAKGEGIISDTGSLVGIINQYNQGNSFTTTTDSLDGGVT